MSHKGGCRLTRASWTREQAPSQLRATVNLSSCFLLGARGHGFKPQSDVFLQSRDKNLPTMYCKFGAIHDSTRLLGEEGWPKEPFTARINSIVALNNCLYGQHSSLGPVMNQSFFSRTRISCVALSFSSLSLSLRLLFITCYTSQATGSKVVGENVCMDFCPKLFQAARQTGSGLLQFFDSHIHTCLRGTNARGVVVRGSNLHT